MLVERKVNNFYLRKTNRLDSSFFNLYHCIVFFIIKNIVRTMLKCGEVIGTVYYEKFFMTDF